MSTSRTARIRVPIITALAPLLLSIVVALPAGAHGGDESTKAVKLSQQAIIALTILEAVTTPASHLG